MIAKDLILSKTNSGFDIYKFILEKMHGRQVNFNCYGVHCSPVANPFKASGTLIIRLEDGIYMYSDKTDFSFKGDPFDFARLYYKVEGDDLKEMILNDLRIEVSEGTDDIYEEKSSFLLPEYYWVDQKAISFFEAPISNVSPAKNISLGQIAELIRNGEYKDSTELLRETEDSSQASEIKRNKFPYVTFSGVFSKRNVTSLEKHSGFIVFDFDHVSDIQSLKNLLLADPFLQTALLFVSPSGDGLKWVVKVDHEDKAFNHVDTFKAISNYLMATYEIEVDQSGKDVSRACFLCHDPNVILGKDEPFPDVSYFEVKKWLNWQKEEPSEAVEVNNREIPVSKERIVDDDLLQQVINVIEQIEAKGVDIAPLYEEYRNIGFAFADAFGEIGRVHYHRVCKLHSTYEFADCDLQYTNCLNSRGMGVKIGTFFHFAKKAGINISVPIEGNVDEIEGNTPTFPSSIFDNLPPILKDSASLFSNERERDVFFIGALGVLSACFPNIYGEYDQELNFSNLFTFVSAPPGSGKGKMKWARYFGSKIHEHLGEVSLDIRDEYLKSGGKTSDKNMPTKKMFYIPGNISSSALHQALKDNNFKGIIFQTEADTLTKALDQEWGDFSPFLRAIFHHEAISLCRRKDNEFIEINDGRLSLVLSGTPDQLRSFIPGAENGLASRFIYYHFNGDIKYKSPFSKRGKFNFKKSFDKHSLKVLELYKKLNLLNEPIEFRLTEKQIIKFDMVFDATLERNKLLFGSKFSGNSIRRALICYRISMILSALRLIGQEHLPDVIECSDQDFETSLAIVKTLEKHAIVVFERYLNSKNKVDKKSLLYNALPINIRFTRKDLELICNKLGVKIKTAERYMKEFSDAGLIDHHYNSYFKIE
eukprot:TRINITY_DN353_c0_g2_i6.p2 TRINITY_DN353_c0_g2~~TRINITY_DN353_c0_g2_i6.p2  ORF type:complete len:876 (-),score=76.81 TRINITY_DN353_c0_g2_i6:18510-21137(-)